MSHVDCRGAYASSGFKWLIAFTGVCANGPLKRQWVSLSVRTPVQKQRDLTVTRLLHQLRNQEPAVVGGDIVESNKSFGIHHRSAPAWAEQWAGRAKLDVTPLASPDTDGCERAVG